MAAFCVACEKVIEPKNLPQQDPRMVLNSIVNSGENIRVNLSVSRSVLSGKDYKYIDNGACELYEDDVYIENLTHTVKGNYVSLLTAKPGRKYSVKASAAGYPGVSAGTTLLPDIIMSAIERYDTVNSVYYLNHLSGGSPFLDGTTKYTFKITDDLSRKNYYSIEPVVLFFDKTGKAIIDTNFKATISDLGDSGPLGNGVTSANSLDIDDLTLVNGKEIQVNIGVSIGYGFYNTGDVDSIEVFLKVHNLSDDLYKYKETINKQYYLGPNLFAEPVLVYSNVSNGMGIFAGDNLKTLRVYKGKPKDR